MEPAALLNTCICSGTRARPETLFSVKDRVARICFISFFPGYYDHSRPTERRLLGFHLFAILFCKVAASIAQVQYFKSIFGFLHRLSVDRLSVVVLGTLPGFGREQSVCFTPFSSSILHARSRNRV